MLRSVTASASWKAKISKRNTITVKPLLHHTNHVLRSAYFFFPVYRHTSVFLRLCWYISFLYRLLLSLPELTVIYFILFFYVSLTSRRCTVTVLLNGLLPFPIVNTDAEECFLFLIQMLLLTFSSWMDALLLLIVEVCHAAFAMNFLFSNSCPLRTLRLELQCFFFRFFFLFLNEVTNEAVPFMIVMKDEWCQSNAALQVSPNFNTVSSGNDWCQDCLNLQLKQIELELTSKADSWSF